MGFSGAALSPISTRESALAKGRVAYAGQPGDAREPMIALATMPSTLRSTVASNTFLVAPRLESAMETPTAAFRAIPLGLIVTCALVFHGPLLMMQYPSNSFDAHFHMSMAQHYAQHWFDPWNEKALGGFSQTTYPPLLHQWIAILSHVVGLSYAFMLVMGSMLILLPVAVYRYAKLWLCELAASYGALYSIFLGSLAIITYESGQIGTVSATTLFLLAIPTAYQYVLAGATKDLILGLALCCTAAGAQHATLLFGTPFFILPTIWLVLREYRESNPESSVATLAKRMVTFTSLASVGIIVELLPYFLALLKSPIEQIPIPHMSRANFLLQPRWDLHYWLMPVGLVALALPYIFYKGVGGSPAAAAVGGILCGSDLWAGRDDTCARAHPTQGVRDSHSRTIHVLGLTVGDALCGAADDVPHRPFWKASSVSICPLSQAGCRGTDRKKFPGHVHVLFARLMISPSGTLRRRSSRASCFVRSCN
jgi:hypothetical protein